MPITPAAVQGFLDPLSKARPITSRKMFGGVGIYSDGVFFAVIDDDRLFFKSDDLTDQRFDEHRSDTWVIAGDPPSVMPYRQVPASILSDLEQLGEWIDASVAVAARKKKAPSKKRKP